MSLNNWKDAKKHIGHKISCAIYGNENISVECETCQEVLMDFEVNE